MSKRRVFVVAATAAALCFLFSASWWHSTCAQLADPCRSEVHGPGGGCVLVCPKGDGDLPAIPYILVVLRDASGTPVLGVPASAIRLIGCQDSLLSTTYADGPTDGSGATTFSGPLYLGGYDDQGFAVSANTMIIMESNCVDVDCVSFDVRSVDFTSPGGVFNDPDGHCDFTDFVRFADYYPSATKPYMTYIDFNCDGAVDFVDLVLFSDHYGH